MENNLLTFQELQIIAIKNGVPDNKTEIGIWAKSNGYFKIRKQKDKKVKIYYFKENGE